MRPGVGGGFIERPCLFKQHQRAVVFAEGAEGGGGIHIGGAGADAALKVHVLQQRDGTLGKGQGILPAACLAVVAHQFVEYQQFSAPVSSLFGLLQPVQQVALGAGIVPPAHIVVQLSQNALLRHRSAVGLRTGGVVAQGAVGFQIFFGSQGAAVTHGFSFLSQAGNSIS